MKKVLALVLAAVMALSLAAVVSAEPLSPVTPGGGPTDPTNFSAIDLLYGDDGVSFLVEDTAATGGIFDLNNDGGTVNTSGLGAPLTADGYVDAVSFRNTGAYSLSVSVSSDNKDVKASYKLVKNDARDGVAIKVTIEPAKEKFTVADASDWEVKVKVVQKLSTVADAVVGEIVASGTLQNTRAIHTDAYTDASGNYIVDAPSLDGVVLANGKNDNARVIDVSVFEIAEGKALNIKYADYSVKFAKVSKQNTSLYLYAKTDVVSVTDTKAIGSIGFQPTRVKDAATITMPVSFDNQNFYGETVYVYNVVDGKPTGAAIPAEVVNHNSIVFSVPAGTALGTYAAYGAQTEGDAEKPAIPETGANDIVNIAIVFAVVALAAAGFVAVKKASK